MEDIFRCDTWTAYFRHICRPLLQYFLDVWIFGYALFLCHLYFIVAILGFSIQWKSYNLSFFRSFSIIAFSWSSCGFLSPSTFNTATSSYHISILINLKMMCIIDFEQQYFLFTLFSDISSCRMYFNFSRMYVLFGDQCVFEFHSNLLSARLTYDRV